MTARFNILLPDALNRQLDQIAAQQGTTKSEIFRRALRLYFAAKEGAEHGLTLCLVDPEKGTIETQFIGF